MNQKKDIDVYGPSDHHIRPQSRGGDRNNGNVIKLSVFFHAHWHNAFSNLTVHEVIRVIKKMEFNESGYPLSVPIEHRHWRSPKNFFNYWFIIFDDLNQEEAIEFIRILFLRKNRIKMGKFWKNSDLIRLRNRIKLKITPIGNFCSNYYFTQKNAA